MSVHFMTQKVTRWVALPLGIIAVTALILQRLDSSLSIALVNDA